MTEKEIQALTAVVNYLEDSELTHYEESESKQSHIYASALILKEYLAN